LIINIFKKLDGFESSKDIKIIMCTNRIDILDPALLRPGRIDRKVEFPHPTIEVLLKRKRLVKIFLKYTLEKWI